MNQYNYFAEDNRLDRLSVIGDPLERVSSINWEIFRPLLESAFYHIPKGPGGRTPYDRVMMFKIVMLQIWYNLSDDSIEYQINDRLSFQRFLGITLSDRVPDAKTVWLFKEQLKDDSTDLKLFSMFAKLMEEQGVITRTGSIVDASFVEVPRQRNSREENKTIKEDNIPEEWQTAENANMLRQKDTDARWAKKNQISYYGYKDHIKIDKDSKMIVSFDVTSASKHDSQSFFNLLDEKDKEVWGDSAYIGDAIHKEIYHDYPNIKMHINEKGTKNTPLTDNQKATNRTKSSVRARVEHIFGHMTQVMNGMTIRCIGIDRAIREIALKNLAYNLHRYSFLHRAGRIPIT
jgi:IS5 family transposase